MPMNVEIRVDAPQALPTIAQVEAGLAKVEARGPAVGAALSKGFGDGSTAAEKAKQSTSSLVDQMAKLANTGSAFSGFADVFKREADALERIKGPAREYAADLQALDSLLQKDAISTKQYADEVTNLNRRMGERPTPAVAAAPTVSHSGGEGGGVSIEGSVSSAFASQTGELGSALEGLASKGALEATAMAALFAEAVNLGDEYVELSNKAMKLADSTHSVDDVLNEQFALSKDLHGSLEQTMELTTIVKERTEDLSVSQHTLNSFTKELAAGVELSGRSMGDAAGLVDRLSFALESGLPAGRQMKSLMAEYPAVAKDMEEATGMTAKQLIDLAQKGQLSMQTLVTSIGGSTKAFDALQNRTETVSAQWQHFKDGLVLTAGKLVEQSGLLTLIGAAFGVLADIIKFVVTVLSGIVQAAAAVHDALGDIGSAAVAMGAAIMVGLGPIGAAIAAFEVLKHATDSLLDSVMSETIARTKRNIALAEANEAYSKEMEAVNKELDAIQQDIDSHGELTEKLHEWADAMAAGKKLLDDTNTSFATSQKKVRDYAAAVILLRQELELLPKKDGGLDPKFLNADEVKLLRDSADAQQHLADSASRYGDLLDKIHKKETERARGIEDLNGALLDGKITQAEFNDAAKEYEVAATKHTAAMSNDEKMYEKIHGAQEKASVDLGSISRLLGEGAISAEEFQIEYQKLLDTISKTPKSIVTGLNYHVAAPDLSSVPAPPKAMSVGALEVFKSTASAADKYAEELEKINAVSNEIGPERTAHAIQDLNEKFGAAISPAERFNKEIDDLNGLFGKGALTWDDYTKKLQDIGKEQEKLADSGKDFASGMSRGWHSIRDEVADTATTIATSMKGAFDEINGDIVTMVTTGTADWSKLATTIEGDLTKLALQKIEGSIFSAVAGKATDTAGAAATGVTTGTSAVETMGLGAAGIGTAIGTAAALAMQGGAAASDAAQGVASAGVGAIAGSWAGSDTYIHAANGYSARVGGVGGTDTKLFAAMVSPGEHVSIQTPDQRAASQRNADGRPIVNVINQDDTRGKLAADFAAGVHDTSFVNMMKRNIGAVQAMLRK